MFVTFGAVKEKWTKCQNKKRIFWMVLEQIKQLQDLILCYLPIVMCKNQLLQWVNSLKAQACWFSQIQKRYKSLQ